MKCFGGNYRIPGDQRSWVPCKKEQQEGGYCKECHKRFIDYMKSNIMPSLNDEGRNAAFEMFPELKD